MHLHRMRIFKFNLSCVGWCLDFFLSSMIREPKNNWLVTSPSSSPENAFYLPGSKESVYVCMGPTMDVQLVRGIV